MGSERKRVKIQLKGRWAEQRAACASRCFYYTFAKVSWESSLNMFYNQKILLELQKFR